MPSRIWFAVVIVDFARNSFYESPTNVCVSFPIASCNDWRWNQLFPVIPFPCTRRDAERFAIRRLRSTYRAADNRHWLRSLFLRGTFTQGTWPRRTQFIRFDSIASFPASQVDYCTSIRHARWYSWQKNHFDQYLPYLQQRFQQRHWTFFSLEKSFIKYLE